MSCWNIYQSIEYNYKLVKLLEWLLQYHARFLVRTALLKLIRLIRVCLIFFFWGGSGGGGIVSFFCKYVLEQVIL